MTLPEGLYDLLLTERLAAGLDMAAARTEPFTTGASSPMARASV